MLQADIAQSIRDRNSGWPFSYTRQPWSISAGLSLPLWMSFSRAQATSQAKAQEDDAREATRARRLEVAGTVQLRLGAVRTAYQAAVTLEANRTLAREQLRQLAQDRYRIGQGTALEVADAQNAVTQAEADDVSAVYDYHQAVVALEAAVGRPLRDAEDTAHVSWSQDRSRPRRGRHHRHRCHEDRRVAATSRSRCASKSLRPVTSCRP